MNRKLDTRHKIQLGGLVIKAGLGEEERAVILGALIEAANKLAGPDHHDAFERWNRMGIRAFRESRNEAK